MSEHLASDQALAVVKSAWIDDWYCIEWAEHDGQQWLERTAPDVVAFRHSGRVSDADVEGTAEEMRRLAAAIQARGSYHAKRCAVAVDAGVASFCSPRNSTKEQAVTLAVADALAVEILRICAADASIAP